MLGLAAQAATAPISVQNTWNITFWDSGPMPVGSFNVLVTASATGSWNSDPSYSALTSALTTSSFGDRILVTGQDADWHYINNAGHQSTFDSSQGFLIDAINWAGSGTGMGGVFLDTEGVADSFFSGLGTGIFSSTDNVIIPAAFASFPINEGLTSNGLSNWGSSAHESWSGTDTSQWTPINIDGSSEGGASVTLVSAATAGGGTGGGGSEGGPAIPEPSAALVFGAGAILVGSRTRRRSGASS